MPKDETHAATYIAGLLAGLILTAVLALAAGVLALVGVVRVSDIAEENTRLREEGEIATCLGANRRIVEIRSAIKDSLLALAPPDTDLTPEQEARIAAYNAAVDGGLALRDCTPAGIDAYLTAPEP